MYILICITQSAVVSERDGVVWYKDCLYWKSFKTFDYNIVVKDFSVIKVYVKWAVKYCILSHDTCQQRKLGIDNFNVITNT